MDISKASNYERLVFDLFENDAAKTKKYMDAFAHSGVVDMADYGVGAHVFSSRGFLSDHSQHADRIATIRMVWEKYRIEIDTHTADGLKVALEHREQGVPVVCLETALPAKFESSMVEALGRKPARPAALDGIENLPQRYELMDADAQAIKRFIADKIDA